MAQCLEALSGETLAVLSNKPVRFLHRIIDGLGLKSVFGAVLGGDTLSIRKPDPAVLVHVLERLGSRDAEVWMVGDSAIDVETGRAAGARTIGCGWGLRGREELRRGGRRSSCSSTRARSRRPCSGPRAAGDLTRPRARVQLRGMSREWTR